MKVAAHFFIVFFVFVLASYTHAVEASVSQDSQTANPYVRTLRYDDEFLVSVDIPTALPPEFSSNMESFNHKHLGDIYTRWDNLFDENGDTVEINGSNNYNLININDKYALFEDGTYFSFQDEETYRLTEPVPGDSELRNSCSEKWVFLDACYSPSYYHFNLEMNNFIFVLNSFYFQPPFQSNSSSENRNLGFVYDLERQEIILSGDLRFYGVGISPNRDYTLIDDRQNNQLIILNDDGIMQNVSKGIGEYQVSCFSEDFIYGYFDDYSSNNQDTKFLMDRTSGEMWNLSQMSEARYVDSIYCTGYSVNTYLIVEKVPLTINEYHNMIVSNDFNKISEMKSHFTCDGGSVGSVVQKDTFKSSSTLRRFLVCTETEPSDEYRLLFDMDTGEYVKLPSSLTPSFVLGDLVLLQHDGCFLWDTSENTITPVIDLSAIYSCSSLLVHDGKVYLNNYLSLVTFTSDGRIDLDDPLVYSEDSTFVGSFTSFVEKTYESSVFPVLLGLIFVAMLYFNKRKFQSVIDELEVETNSKIEALELEISSLANANISSRNRGAIPSIDDVGYPDDEGFEWTTTEDGRNWYRSTGSRDEWIEYSD